MTSLHVICGLASPPQLKIWATPMVAAVGKILRFLQEIDKIISQVF